MLKILGRTSSINVRKVLWTCAEVGVPYEREDWGAGFRATEAEEFRKLNPNALIPVLIEGDFVLWESNTICRYLAGSHRRDDLLPQAPRDRALVEKWMDWQATELNNAWRYAFMALAHKSPAYADPDRVKESVTAWNHRIGILDRQLQATGAYAAGGSFTLADIVLGLSVNRWYRTPFDKPELPHLFAYYERLSGRPPFMELARNGAP